MAELLDLAYLPRLPSSAFSVPPYSALTTPVLYALQLVWLLPLGSFLRNHHDLPGGKYSLRLVFLGVPCVGQDLGDQQLLGSAVLALLLLPLCCLHLSLLTSDLVST